MPDEILSAKKVTAQIEFAQQAVFAMAQAGKTPSFKIRGQWLARRIELDRASTRSRAVAAGRRDGYA